MAERLIQCTAVVEKQDDGTYSVIVEVTGLRRHQAHAVADMLEQPVVKALESFGELRALSREFGHA